MGPQRLQPTVSIDTIHFRGIKTLATQPPSATVRSRPAAWSRVCAEKPVRFLGIGAGGRTPDVAARERDHPDPGGAGRARQQRADALLDRCAAAAGIT
ncbi:hypothetical protein [Rhodopila sp.]|uniref:hypothetical protein n=1 Tax=Rhodopila sp. TaxID=2480087 RepID=UPI003D0D9B97